jgi:hypothetical protein
LSGGGHRAALWAAGALLGVVDAGAAPNTVSISSVSGGSITNGVVAAGQSFASIDRPTLESELRPAIRQWATDGLFFTGDATDGYVKGLFFRVGLLLATVVAAFASLVALGRDWSTATVIVLGIVLSIVVVAVAALLGSRLPHVYFASIVGGAVFVVALTIGGMFLTVDPARWPVILLKVIVVAAVLGAAWTATARHFEDRSAAVDRALGAGLLSDGGSPIPLARAAPSPVLHVFCTTNLATADHAYLSNRLVYGHGLGVAAPATSLAMATAVQVSACLPGAFAPRVLPSRVLADNLDDEEVAFTDGGVYDNMADQWEFGYENRVGLFEDRGSDLHQFQTHPADELLVVNASRAFGKSAISPKSLIGEITALLRCKDVLYDVSTAVRRRYLVDMYEEAARSGRGLGGALVHIGQPPTRVPAAFAQSPDAQQADRAAKAKAFLDRLHALEPVDWIADADRNGSVPTTLGPIGVADSVRLLHHAYVLTRVNAYVVLDRGSLPAPDVADSAVLDEFARARFEALVS